MNGPASAGEIAARAAILDHTILEPDATEQVVGLATIGAHKSIAETY